MYGQMTAGSWIYIGTQGILQGTYETFAAVAAKQFGGTLAGTITLTAGLGGMGGAQPLAVTMNDGVAICIDCDPRAIARRIEHRYLDVRGRLLDARAAAGGRGPRRSAGRSRSALLGNAAELVPQLLAMDAPIDIVTDQTSAHDPLAYLPIGVDFDDMADLRGGQARPSSPRRPASRWPGTSRRWSASRTRAPRCSTTATRSAARPSWPATSGPSTSPASCRRTSGRCSARARARSAGPRCPATRRTSPPPTRRSSTCSRENESLAPLDQAGRRAGALPGPAGAHLLARLRRARQGRRCASTSMVASGEVSAPIVIGRDHLDCGSVASPVPRDRGDAGRLGRDRRLAAAQRDGQRRLRRVLGVDPPRRRRRHGPLDPRRPGHGRRRHRRWPARSSRGC